MQAGKIAEICGTVMRFFSRTIKEVSQEARFVKRNTSRIDGKLFAEVLIAGCLSDSTISLERLCCRMKERGIRISKQGLHQRFNEEATRMMRNLLSAVLTQFKLEREELPGLLKRFSGVKIVDSSGIELASCLKDDFKGYGGTASAAGLKIQTIFDYVHGQLDEVTITKRSQGDQGFRGHWNWLEEGGLCLQDLGYFNVKFFDAVQEKKAYFVSRYLYPTSLWEADDKPVNLLDKLRKAGSIFEEKLKLGPKGKVTVRLIAFRLSEEEAEKRRRESRKKAQRKGTTQSQELIELAAWSIYITNLSEDEFEANQVYLLYSLRWQIELFFKLCKSEAGIDKVSGKKKDRVLCELYAKLICVAILMYLCLPVRWLGNQELSLSKAYKAFKTRAAEFYKTFRSRYRLTQFIQSFLADLTEFAMKDKYRKKRQSTHQKIMNCTPDQKVFV